MRLAIIPLILLLTACDDEPRIPDEQLPALVLLSDSRCALVDQSRSRHEVECVLTTPQLVATVSVYDPTCGTLVFNRAGPSLSMVCTSGCEVAKSTPQCPITHRTGLQIWTLHDRR